MTLCLCSLRTSIAHKHIVSPLLGSLQLQMLDTRLGLPTRRPHGHTRSNDVWCTRGYDQPSPGQMTVESTRRSYTVSRPLRWQTQAYRDIFQRSRLSRFKPMIHSGGAKSTSYRNALSRSKIANHKPSQLRFFVSQGNVNNNGVNQRHRLYLL